MRSATVVFLALSILACDSTRGPAGAQPSPAAAADGAAPAQAAAAVSSPFPLRVSGTGFLRAGGEPFPWRGVTAFRLAEMIAGGREQEAVAYLDWARREDVTVVRVLLMAHHLFQLSPDAGRRALPRLLDLAKERGIAVEAVPFADTREVAVDFEAHVREIGRIAAAAGNAFVEIANEPGHPTQNPRLHDAAFAQRLAALVPDPVIVALGSVEYGEGYAAGDYATFHFPRGAGGWDHVFELAAGARRVAELKKPIISDEPIGAAPDYEPGRRDNEPARFAAAAALTRLAGMWATFHYEGGLHARVPAGREAACFAAWRAGLALLEGLDVTDGEFVDGERVSSVAAVTGARRPFARVGPRQAVLLLVDPREEASVRWAPGWTETRRSGVPGALVLVAERRP